jgi:membrane protease subunit (stomatin/prohibitin family)
MALVLAWVSLRWQLETRVRTVRIASKLLALLTYLFCFPDVYEDLRVVLFNDSAVAGEAAGYAMGLVMLGTFSDKALEEMLQYAQTRFGAKTLYHPYAC